MEKLLNPADISARYGFKDKNHRKAKQRMREMEHLENPLLVTESAVLAWERLHTEPPSNRLRQTKKKRNPIPVPLNGGKHLVSRERPKLKTL